MSQKSIWEVVRQAVEGWANHTIMQCIALQTSNVMLLIGSGKKSYTPHKSMCTGAENLMAQIIRQEYDWMPSLLITGGHKEA